MDVLKDCASAEEYQRGMEFFFAELAHLGSTIYVVECIDAFPWDVFGNLGRRPHFFRLVALNFLQYGTLLAVRVYKDSSSSAYDIEKFKKRILENLIKHKYKMALQRTLDEVGFDPKVEQGFKKARTLRNKMLAHSDKQWFPFSETSDSAEDEDITSFRLSELCSLRDALDSLYAALRLGSSTSGLPLQRKLPIYAERPSQEWIRHRNPDADLQANLDDILNNLARNSWVWDLPEKDPVALGRLTNDQIGKFTAYRQKLGESKITFTQEQFDAINDNFGWRRDPPLPSTYLQ